MSRWYSKKRKSRMNGDLSFYGFIPPRSKISIAEKEYKTDPKILKLNGYLEICQYTGECDKCANPKKKDKVWASVIHYPEDNSDCDYVICKRCLIRNHHSRMINEKKSYAYCLNISKWKRLKKLSPDEEICGFCDQVFSGECHCDGARYWRENK